MRHSWSADEAIPLTWTPDHVWKTELKLPPGPVEYKYILQWGNTIRWEEGNNHAVTMQPHSRVCITDFWQEGPPHRLLLALSPTSTLPKVASLLRLHKTEVIDDREDE